MTVDIVSARNLLVLIMSVHCHCCSLNLLSVRWLAGISCICQLMVAAHCVLTSLFLHFRVTGQ